MARLDDTDGIDRDAVVGAAITEIVQLWLAVSVVGQSLDCVNSPTLDTSTSWSDAFPVFVSVTVCALLIVSTGVSGKLSAVVDVFSTPA